MEKTFFKKKLPLFLGLGLVTVGIGTALFFFAKSRFIKTKGEVFSPPQNVRISNIQDDKFTLSWTTSTPVNALVHYGTTPSTDKTAVDDRDQRSGDTGKYKVHYVTIKNLKPEKTFHLAIDASEKQYKVVTGPSIKASKETRVVSGKILSPGKIPVNGTVVYLSAENMATLSTLTDKTGQWTIFLNQARTKDLSENAVFDLEATVFRIEANDGNNKVEAIILSKNAFPTIPDLILGHELYDFRKEATAEQMIVEKALVTIDNPAQDEEEINAFRPEFIGQGPVNKVLTITIESAEPYTALITVDDSGKWSFTPPFDLSPGRHTISISYTTEDEEEKKN